MPLAQLLATLEHDADAEVRAALAAGNTAAAGVDAASASARARRLADASNAFGDERRAAAGAELATLEHAARRETLSARAAMLDRILAAIRVALPDVVDDRARDRLRVAAGADARAVPTGYVAERADGTLVEATLDAVLDREWPRLATEALAIVEAT